MDLTKTIIDSVIGAAGGEVIGIVKGVLGAGYKKLVGFKNNEERLREEIKKVLEDEFIRNELTQELEQHNTATIQTHSGIGHNIGKIEHKGKGDIVSGDKTIQSK